jgi:cytochrome c-type biogenesis protein
VSFVAIGLFVATIGYSIGLDADFFHDVAGADVQGRLALAGASLANWGDRNATPPPAGSRSFRTLPEQG